jgi:NAD(P)H-nitrite reductase large subunit
MKEDPIICGCNDIHRSAITTAIKEKGFRTAEQINKEFHLDKACGSCTEEVRQVLNEVKGN